MAKQKLRRRNYKLCKSSISVFVQRSKWS